MPQSEICFGGWAMLELVIVPSLEEVLTVLMAYLATGNLALWLTLSLT